MKWKAYMHSWFKIILLNNLERKQNDIKCGLSYKNINIKKENIYHIYLSQADIKIKIPFSSYTH